MQDGPNLNTHEEEQEEIFVLWFLFQMHLWHWPRTFAFISWCDSKSIILSMWVQKCFAQKHFEFSQLYLVAVTKHVCCSPGTLMENMFPNWLLYYIETFVFWSSNSLLLKYVCHPYYCAISRLLLFVPILCIYTLLMGEKFIQSKNLMLVKTSEI